LSLCGAYCKWLSSLGKERTDPDINGVLREARGHQDAKDDPVDGHAKGFPKIFSRERLRGRNGMFLLGIWRREGIRTPTTFKILHNLRDQARNRFSRSA
jgi:hypothetical protein